MRNGRILLMPRPLAALARPPTPFRGSQALAGTVRIPADCTTKLPHCRMCLFRCEAQEVVAFTPLRRRTCLLQFGGGCIRISPTMPRQFCACAWDIPGQHRADATDSLGDESAPGSLTMSHVKCNAISENGVSGRDK